MENHSRKSSGKKAPRSAIGIKKPLAIAKPELPFKKGERLYWIDEFDNIRHITVDSVVPPDDRSIAITGHDAEHNIYLIKRSKLDRVFETKEKAQKVLTNIESQYKTGDQLYWADENGDIQPITVIHPGGRFNFEDGKFYTVAGVDRGFFKCRNNKTGEVHCLTIYDLESLVTEQVAKNALAGYPDKETAQQVVHEMKSEDVEQQKAEIETQLGNLFNLIHEKQTELNQLNLLIDQATTPEGSGQLLKVKKDLIQTLKKARLQHAELWNSSYDM
jgi:hypothetical protein